MSSTTTIQTLQEQITKNAQKEFCNTLTELLAKVATLLNRYYIPQIEAEPFQKFITQLLRWRPNGGVECFVSQRDLPETLKRAITEKACTDLLKKFEEIQEMQELLAAK